MAYTGKNFLDYTGLSTYDGLIKNYIDTADALSIKYAEVSQDGNNLLLYKVASPEAGTTADFTIPMGSTALKNFVKSLGTAVGATLNQEETAYSVTFTGDIAAATDVVTAVQLLDTHIGTLASLTTTDKTSIVAAINEVLGAISIAIGNLDASEFALASKDINDIITIKGIKETDGIIEIGTDTTKDVTLAKIAATGSSEDVSYDNTTSGLISTNVQTALDELAEASAGGIDSKTVYITETAGSPSDAFSKRYGIYQGANGSSSSPIIGEKLADIDIPKDMVVESGSVVDITYNAIDGKLYDGFTDVTELIKGAGGTATEADAGKYIKLIIANANSNILYIAAKDLVDIYTVEQNATQVQLAIDNNNVISATIVAGSINTTELANGAITTIKIADDAVTADKISISAHTESQTAGADGIAVSVTTTDGQVSGVVASIAAETYDNYGEASDVYDSIGSITDTQIESLFS